MSEKVNTADSIKYLEKAIQVYINNNKLSYAAKTNKKIAELYENDKEFSLAVRFYQEAADNYQAEKDNVSSYNACMLKVTELAIYQPEIDYAGTIKILESIANRYLQNKLTAPSAKDLYFKAVMLHLAHDDTIGAQQALDSYTDSDVTFPGTRQHSFLKALIKCINEKNVKGFAEECYQFNQIIPLDKWKTFVLSKAKATIPSVAEGGAAGATPNEEEEL